MRGTPSALAAVFALTATLVCTPPIVASEALVGVWKPSASNAADTSWALLVFTLEGRFALFSVRPSAPSSAILETLPDEQRHAAASVSLPMMGTVSGTWLLAEDGGEVVLNFDTWSSTDPAWKRRLQLLLIEAELRPYPGMRGRSPIAGTSWQKVTDPFGRRSNRR